MIALRVALLLARPSRTGAAAAVLPVLAFAVVTALGLVVVAGAATFFVPSVGTTVEMDGIYQVFAGLAGVLLLSPLATLGGAAARLSARRREDRLAALRLLGGTAALVRATTAIESALLAGAGAVVGVGLYAVLLPAVGLLRFRGHVLGAGALWLGTGPTLAVVAAVVVLASLSGITALRRVVLSPLGVITRATPPPQRWVRLGMAAAVVVAWALVWNVGSATVHTTLALTVVVVVGVGAVLAVLNLAGPVLVAVVGRRALRRAQSAERLMAARAVLEDPKGTWRSVGGVAMVTFVAVVTGVGLALLGGAGGDLSGPEALLVADARTGVLVTLVGSFVMVAASASLTAAASVIDRRATWVALDRAGMARSTMHAARTLAVMAPLRAVTVGAVVLGAGVVAPVTGIAVVLRPLAVLVLLGCVVLGVGLVALALRATRPVLSAVLAAPERA